MFRKVRAKNGQTYIYDTTTKKRISMRQYQERGGGGSTEGGMGYEYRTLDLASSRRGSTKGGMRHIREYLIRNCFGEEKISVDDIYLGERLHFLVDPQTRQAVTVLATDTTNRKDGSIYVLNVCTDRQHLRQGLARQLFRRLLLGNERIVLDVWANNVPAIALYESLGFRKTRTGYKYRAKSGKREAYHIMVYHNPRAAVMP